MKCASSAWHIVGTKYVSYYHADTHPKVFLEQTKCTLLEVVQRHGKAGEKVLLPHSLPHLSGATTLTNLPSSQE